MATSPRKFTGESMYNSKFGPRTAVIPRSPSAQATLNGGSVGAPTDFGSTNGSKPSPRSSSAALAPLDATKLAGSITEQYLARKKKDTMANLIAADVQAYQEEEAARSARRRQVIIDQRNALQAQISARDQIKEKAREESNQVGRLNRETDEASRRSVSEQRRHQLQMRAALNAGMDEQKKELKERREKKKAEDQATAANIVAEAIARKEEENQQRLDKKIMQERLNRQMMAEQDSNFKRRMEIRDAKIEEERLLLSRVDDRLAREEHDRKLFIAKRQRDLSSSASPLDHKAVAAKEREEQLEAAKRNNEFIEAAREQQHKDKIESQKHLQTLLRKQQEAAEAKKNKEREEALAQRRRAEEDARKLVTEIAESKSVARGRALELRLALEDQMNDRLKREYHLTDEEFEPISPARRRMGTPRGGGGGNTPRGGGTPRLGTPRSPRVQ